MWYKCWYCALGQPIPDGPVPKCIRCGRRVIPFESIQEERPGLCLNRKAQLSLHRGSKGGGQRNRRPDS